MSTSETPTPRVADAIHRFWMGGDWSNAFADFARQLERELSAAKADSERLDWLEKHAFDVRHPHRASWTVNYVEHHVWCYSSATKLRKAIDIAREETTP